MVSSSVRTFKTKWFGRFADKENLGDDELKAVVTALEAGEFAVNLGGGVYKQRIARDGGGKSGGYRVIVLLKSGEMAFFVYGFSKSTRENIDDKEKREFKKMAKYYFELDEKTINAALEAGKFIEITE
jgi:hypothetical protein